MRVELYRISERPEKGDLVMARVKELTLIANDTKVYE